MRILLVEDECSLADIYKTVLSSSGHEVEATATGRGALLLLYHWEYDVVLLDIMMAGGNGFTVLEQMQKNGDQTPVFIHSNLDMGSKKERAKSFPNVVDFLMKIDHTPRDLVTTLENWYGRNREQDTGG